MSTVALISDIHLGIRNDSYDFLKNHENFFTEIFFPECEKRNVDTVIHCGDLTDRRKQINFNTVNKAKNFLFDKIKSKNMTFYSIVGNHDSYYKNTIKINSLRELDLENYNFIIIDEPKEIKIYDETLCFIPWICSENEEQCLRLIQETNSQFCFGHFSIENFEMQRGRFCENGLSPKIFEKFTQVFSGHFHHSSSKGNIFYLGSCSQYTWNDYGDDRGFYFFNLKTHDLEFVPNSYRMFTKIEYDEEKTEQENLAFNFESIKNSYCKIIVKSQSDKKKFKKFLEKIDASQLINLKVVDQTQNLEEEKEITNDEIQDTKTILLKYSEKDKQLRDFLLDLYSEALLLE